MDLMANLGISSFPSELVSNDEKKSFAYGQKYASAIWYEWNGKMSSRHTTFNKLRKYANGDQDIEDCKKNISGEYTDLQYWEVDWNDKLNILPVLLRNFANSVNMDELQPVVKAIDPTAIEYRNKRKEEKLKNFYAKDFLQNMAQLNGGQSIIPLDNIPQSKEQVELEEQTAEPLKIEKAESLALEVVARDNFFHLIQKDILEEMLITNYGIGKISTCPIRGIVIEKVLADNFVHGKTSNKYFSDCPYYGEVKYLTIGEIKNIAKESNLSFTNEELEDMMNSYDSSVDNKKRVKVLFYNFKTFIDESAVVKKVYSKKINRHTGAIKLIPKEEYKPRSENEKPEVVVDNYDVWFEGIMVLNSKKTIIRHRLMQNMAENKMNGSIVPPYIVMKPRAKSIVEEVIPRINAIQELRYRILHFRNTLKGSITRLDPDMIANVTIGNEKLTPKEVLSMYFTKGIQFVKTRDEDGEYIPATANITDIDTPIPRALIQLSQEFITEIQLLNQAFGATQYDQASPDPKSLTLGEVYRFSNNSSLRDYTDSLYQWTVMCYRSVSSRINDVIKWKDVRNKFISAIGTDDVETIELFKNERANHFFGIYTDLIPTDEERANLAKRMEIYLNNGTLTPLDEQRISNVRNRTQALSMLNLIIMSKQKEIQQSRQQEAQSQVDVNTQSAIAAAQAKAENMKLEYQLRAEEQRIEFERKAFLLQKEGEIKITEANIAAGAKIQATQWNSEFQKGLTETRKQADYKARMDGIDKSAYNQQQLIKLRKGEIDSIDATTPMQEPNLAELDNQYNQQTL